MVKSPLNHARKYFNVRGRERNPISHGRRAAPRNEQANVRSLAKRPEGAPSTIRQRLSRRLSFSLVKVGAGSGNRTHASTLGRSQAAITSYPRARRAFRFEHPLTASYGPDRIAYEMTLIERASTIAMVISEISASTVIRALAQRLNGMTSAGLKAVESVNER